MKNLNIKTWDEIARECDIAIINNQIDQLEKAIAESEPSDKRLYVALMVESTKLREGGKISRSDTLFEQAHRILNRNRNNPL